MDWLGLRRGSWSGRRLRRPVLGGDPLEGGDRCDHRWL